MTPESQRIAIAEACGWTEIWSADRLYGKPPDGGSAIYVVPGYLHDLNACHEMEKIMTSDQWTRYIAEVGGTNYSWRECCVRCTHATAAQRCEAFLRTLGLWREPSS